MYQNEKEKQESISGNRGRTEVMVWAPPRNISKWPDWEEAREREESEWRLEPEGEAKVPEIIIVSDAVEGTFVDLDGKSLQEEQKEKHQRKWKRSKGVDRTEIEKGREEI